MAYLERADETDVLLVSEREYHVFSFLLYDVIAGTPFRRARLDLPSTFREKDIRIKRFTLDVESSLLSSTSNAWTAKGWPTSRALSNIHPTSRSITTCSPSENRFSQVRQNVDWSGISSGSNPSAVAISESRSSMSANSRLFHPRSSCKTRARTIDSSDFASTVVAGEPFSFKVHWQSGHGSDACFISAVDASGWTQCGKDTQSALSVGEHRHFTMSSTVPRSIGSGTYTFRVSASEAYHRCPHPGECNYPIKCADAPDGGTIEVRPPVEVADVSFRGCSEVWVAFDAFPVDSVAAQVNINGNWQGITISKGDLTKIPGQYGDKPVFKYSVSGGDKLVGLKIVGDTYTNTNNCAKNV